jgi:hypothetical protein
MLRIPYTPKGFPPSAGLDRAGTEIFGWAELVHAAITVGRRNWSDVIRHGSYSILEVLWRVAMLRANLGTNSFNRLIRSAAYDRLDPAEKTSVSFFLGNCIAKALCSRLFNVPWLLHLSVYWDDLGVGMTAGSKERPDFVGFDAANRAIVVEAKGRTRGVDSALMTKAKRQARLVTTIGGIAPTARIAVASYFSDRGLRVNIQDPWEPLPGAVGVDLSPDRLAHLYYRNVFDFVRTLRPDTPDILAVSLEGVELPGFDAKFRLAEDVARWFLREEGSFDDVRARRSEAGGRLARYSTEHDTAPLELVATQAQWNDGFFGGPDGVTVLLGASWTDEFMSRGPAERWRER